MNVLQVIQAALYEGNVTPPSAVYNQTDPAALQMLYLLYAVGRELRQAKCWPQLKRTHTITTVAGTTTYPLPADFYCSILDAAWNTTTGRPLAPPSSDAEFNEILYGVVELGDRTHYRVFGRQGSNQFEIRPTPGNGTIIKFDYLSSGWILNGSTWQEAIGSDNDTFAFEDDLLILGLKAKFYREKGWDWQPLQGEFDTRISKSVGRFQGPLITTMYNARQGPELNVPEGNFG